MHTLSLIKRLGLLICTLLLSACVSLPENVDDGGVKVINRGYSASKGEWKEAVGKAFFVREKNEGYLKVSFFSIFYGAYVVIELDQEDYQYSLVSGPDKSFLWVLSRTPEMDPDVYQRLISKASALGFATDELILVDQN